MKRPTAKATMFWVNVVLGANLACQVAFASQIGWAPYGNCDSLIYPCDEGCVNTSIQSYMCCGNVTADSTPPNNYSCCNYDCKTMNCVNLFTGTFCSCFTNLHSAGGTTGTTCSAVNEVCTAN